MTITAIVLQTHFSQILTTMILFYILIWACFAAILEDFFKRKDNDRAALIVALFIAMIPTLIIYFCIKQ